MNSKRLKRLFEAGDLEVEHILAFSKVATVKDVPFLLELGLLAEQEESKAKAEGWKTFPLTKWLRYVAAFAQNGTAGLMGASRGKASEMPFVLDVLCENASASGVAECLKGIALQADTKRLRQAVLDTINLMYSFGKNPAPNDPWFPTFITTELQRGDVLESAIYAARGFTSPALLEAIERAPTKTKASAEVKAKILRQMKGQLRQADSSAPKSGP